MVSLVGHGGGEGLTAGHFAFHRIALEGDFADLLLQHLLGELGIGDSADAVGCWPVPWNRLNRITSSSRDNDPKRKISEIIQEPSFSDRLSWPIRPSYWPIRLDR